MGANELEVPASFDPSCDGSCYCGRYLETKKNMVHVSAKLQMCLDIANGMLHLSNHRFVHRDLAARNVLVDLSIQCKVADFGLSRATKRGDGDDGGGEGVQGDYAYMSATASMIPIRWSSPEAIYQGLFNEASDVWAFGITCVEVFQDGQRPYDDVSTHELISALATGPCQS